MSDFQQALRPMLKQFSNAVGRGNLIAANATLVTILESMAVVIDRAACSCNCGPRMEAQPAPPSQSASQSAPQAPRPRGRPRKQR
jgi:hypothetical protein